MIIALNDNIGYHLLIIKIIKIKLNNNNNNNFNDKVPSQPSAFDDFNLMGSVMHLIIWGVSGLS